MAQKIDSIIFDLDGTLVDSQPAALGATVEALSRFGVHTTDADIREQCTEVAPRFAVAEQVGELGGKGLHDLARDPTSPEVLSTTMIRSGGRDEVSPGTWLISAGMRGGARSVRGLLPDE